MPMMTVVGKGLKLPVPSDLYCAHAGHLRAHLKTHGGEKSNKQYDQWSYGHMQKNMAKWGIPEKSIKNAAQRC